MRQIQVGIDTWEEVLELLGRPQVVDSPELHVHAREASTGYLVVAAGTSGSGGSVGLKGTRAFVQFDAEGSVFRIEASTPTNEPELPTLSCHTVPDLCRRDRPGSSGPLVAAFSPKGAELAIIHGSRKMGSCIQDPGSGRVLASFDYHPTICAGVVFSNDGNRLAAIGTREPLTVWNLGDSSEPRHFEPADEEWLAHCRISVALSADGSRIASDGPDGGLTFWDVETGEVLLEQKLGGTPVHHPAFSPDGTLVAAGHRAGVLLLDAMTGSVVAERPGPPEGEWPNIPTFSPDGGYLVVASCVHVEIWSIPRDWDSGWSGSPETIRFLPFPRSAGVLCDIPSADRKG